MSDLQKYIKKRAPTDGNIPKLIIPENQHRIPEKILNFLLYLTSINCPIVSARVCLNRYITQPERYNTVVTKSVINCHHTALKPAL